MSNQFASGITNERQWQGTTEEETGRARGVHGDMRTSEGHNVVCRVVQCNKTKN